MTINEERRQPTISAEMTELAGALARATRTGPNPTDARQIVGDLAATAEHLAQVSEQLATWYEHVEDGVHYDGQDPGTEGTHRTVVAATHLREAAHEHLRLAAAVLRLAETANDVIRWNPEPQAGERDGSS